jgi:hypothetical protein
VLVPVELDRFAQGFVAFDLKEWELELALSQPIVTIALTRPSATLSRGERVFFAPSPTGRGLG